MKLRIFTLLALLAMLLGMAACRKEATPEPTEAATPTVVAPEPTATVQPAETASPTVAVTAELTRAPEEVASTFEETPCPFALPSGHVEGETVECGYLIVPENRVDPEGRVIRLAVAIFRHPGGAPEPDPIIYLEGGPGGSPLEMRAPNFDAYLGPMFAANRDIILFDQRGVGFSEPALDCPAFTALYLDLLDSEVDGQTLAAQEILDRKVETFMACAEELSTVADLSAYNTVANAADVNDLRLALGYEVVNLWGGSYGTRLALGVMRDFPEGLRSVVLDAPYGPEVDLYLATPSSFDRALTVLTKECADDDACNAAYPDLRAVLDDTVTRLNASPATVEVIHPLTGESYTKLLDGAGLTELVFRSLYDTSMRPLLPQAIYAAGEGTFSSFLPTAMLDILRQEFRSWGMYFSVLCNEEIPFSTRQEFEAVVADYPGFAGFFAGFEVGGLAYAVCPGWGAGQPDARENEPVTSDIPTLIMTGEYDPIVPPGWGQRAAGTLTNSYFFEYPGMGHGVSFGSCPRSMMLAFLDDPSAAPDDACIAETQVARFVVPMEAADIELEPFSSKELGIRGVVPAGWSQVQPGIFARGNPAVDMAVLQVAVEDTMSPKELLAAMAKGYGLAETPGSTGERQANDLTWSFYALEVQGVPRDLALAESKAGTLIVLLRSATDERDALYEAVFLPVVDALVPLAAEDEAVYEDPAGRFSVPIPTNWTAEQGDGYGILTSPDKEITLYVLAVEGDDIEQAVKTAWAVVDPEFVLEPKGISERPPPAGMEKVVVITYDAGDEGQLLWASGRLYKSIVYVFLGQADSVAYEKRASQLSIIGSGFAIKALEVTDLGGVAPLPLTDDLIAELESYVIETMELLGVPGVAVAIVEGDEIAYAKGFGVRERGGDEPVTPETLMRIGSTTKSMTTMMMATLVDEGVMDWDTPVVEILPTFKVADPEITPKITVRNLVCACTGVPRRDAELRFNGNELSAEGIIESLADFQFFTDFGEAFQYSNQMVAAGGYVAALAAGGEYGNLYDSYVALMQERILDPIGMTSSTFSPKEAQAGGNYVTPHNRDLAGEYVPIPYMLEAYPLPPIAPSGALSSNVLDMGRYLITLLNRGIAPDGTRVVSAENLAKTWEPQVAMSADTSYGLGWVVSEYKGLLTLSHAGNTLGCTSQLALLPEADLGIGVLSNAYGTSLNELIGIRLLELLYQQEPEMDAATLQYSLDQVEGALAKLAEQLVDSADPDAVVPYLGRYANDALGEIVVESEESMLTLDAGEFKLELLPRVGEDGKVIAYQSVTTGLGYGFRFSKDDDGSPVIVLGSPPYEYTFEKVE